MNDSKWSSQNTVSIHKHQFLLVFSHCIRIWGVTPCAMVGIEQTQKQKGEAVLITKIWTIINHFTDGGEKVTSVKSNFVSFKPACHYYSTSDKLSNTGRFPRRLCCSSFLVMYFQDEIKIRHLQGQQYAEDDRSFRITLHTHLRTDLYNLRVAPSTKVWSLTVPPPVEPNLHRPWNSTQYHSNYCFPKILGRIKSENSSTSRIQQPDV